MDATAPPTDDNREMLRDSLRGFLGDRWRVAARVQIASPDDVSTIWRGLVGQGVASLGSDPGESGLAEIVVVMAELGRAACPAPMWSAALTNLALSSSRDDAAAELLAKLHGGEASV